MSCPPPCSARLRELNYSYTDFNDKRRSTTEERFDLERRTAQDMFDTLATIETLRGK